MDSCTTGKRLQKHIKTALRALFRLEKHGDEGENECFCWRCGGLKRSPVSFPPAAKEVFLSAAVNFNLNNTSLSAHISQTSAWAYAGRLKKAAVCASRPDALLFSPPSSVIHQLCRDACAGEAGAARQPADGRAGVRAGGRTGPFITHLHCFRPFPSNSTSVTIDWAGWIWGEAAPGSRRRILVHYLQNNTRRFYGTTGASNTLKGGRFCMF